MENLALLFRRKILKKGTFFAKIILRNGYDFCTATRWSRPNQICRHHYSPSLLFTKFMTVLNPLSTTGLLTPFLIGSYHEILTCLANHGKTLNMLHHKLEHDTIFSYTIFDWFNKWQTIHFDQSAGSTHGVKYHGNPLKSD